MKVLKFGGNILVTPTFTRGENVGRLILQTGKGTGKIGEYSKNFEQSQDDVVLEFKNPESIDVVIERLNKTKEMMLGNLSGCREIQGLKFESVEIR